MKYTLMILAETLIEVVGLEGRSHRNHYRKQIGCSEYADVEIARFARTKT